MATFSKRFIHKKPAKKEIQPAFQLKENILVDLVLELSWFRTCVWICIAIIETKENKPYELNQGLARKLSTLPVLPFFFRIAVFSSLMFLSLSFWNNIIQLRK